MFCCLSGCKLLKKIFKGAVDLAEMLLSATFALGKRYCHRFQSVNRQVPLTFDLSSENHASHDGRLQNTTSLEQAKDKRPDETKLRISVLQKLKIREKVRKAQDPSAKNSPLELLSHFFLKKKTLTNFCYAWPFFQINLLEHNVGHSKTSTVQLKRMVRWCIRPMRLTLRRMRGD